MRFKLKLSRVRLVAFLICVMPAAAAFAGQTIFLVDPARSSLTLSGTFNGAPLGPQFSVLNSNSLVGSSLFTSYAGSITANVGADNATLQITGGNIAAQDIPMSYSHPPFSSGISANYGVYENNGAYENNGPFIIISSQFAAYYGAIRGFSFSLGGSVIGSPANFDASDLSGAIASGELDSQYVPDGHFGPIGSSQFSGSLALASGTASLVDVGSTDILTIPISTDITIELSGLGIPNEPVPVDLHLSGDIVATVPAPPAWFGGGLLIALIFGWHLVGTCPRREKSVVSV